jgi:tRNA modification GTPase
MAQSFDTIAAIASPSGSGALAIIRISGPDALTYAKLFQGSIPRPRFAKYADYKDKSGVIVDDAVFTYFPENNSATGEHVLEITCHGNPYITQRILSDLLERGCRLAEPGEFTRRSFLNGRIDLSQAEAVMDIISARSERALAAANRQLRGGLARHMKPLIDDLITAVATVEAYIDFPEEDLPREDKNKIKTYIDAILFGSNQLLTTQRYGDLLRDGIRIVIVGEPNAGKSSLLNRMVGKNRAIVSPTAGTTRDFLEERMIVGPHCVRFIDTAGLNKTPDQIEKMGIDKTIECIESADIILLVIDSTNKSYVADSRITKYITISNTLVVFNKADLLKENPPIALSPIKADTLVVSSLNGEGIDSLKSWIINKADNLKPSADEDAVFINARHAHALSQARTWLFDASAKLQVNEPTELLASDLRSALNALGEISGHIDNEQILDKLFASFCIGK